MSQPPVIGYASPSLRRRFSRLAIFAFCWTLTIPAAMLGVVVASVDILDDIWPRDLLFAILLLIITAAPLVGILLGGIAIGRIRSRALELRGMGFAIMAVVLAWLLTISLAWLCAIAPAWG